MIKPTTIDFETFAIEGRPAYPPVPVGVSIKPWGKRAKYYAWGHATGNTCQWGEGYRALQQAYKNPDGLLFQNGKFDVDVAAVHMGIGVPDWKRIHDTLFLLFLDDPHAMSLSLKPSAQRLLGLAPDEQDAVKDWLVKNQPLKVHGITISASAQSPNTYGKYIAYAPGELVGKYANGDVDRTEGLFKLLHPNIIERGMLEAYDRERELMPILLDLERQGVRVDAKRLGQDIVKYVKLRGDLDDWIKVKIKAPADINLSSGPQLVNAMVAAGLVDTAALGRTKTGKFKTDKESLLLGVKDAQLLAVLKYRTQLNTCLNTFMLPWHQTAMASGGLIFCNWNQVRGDEAGARTGRLSSTPNFQNIPKEFQAIFRHQDPANKALPLSPFKVLPSLPLVRSYIIPWAKDHVLLDRDYSQQELRILGHFEDGVLKDGYTQDPWLDVHDHAQKLINQMMNKNFSRKIIKNTGFGLLYGMGVGKLAIKSDVTVEVAKEVKDAYLAIFPGLKQIYRDMKGRAQAKQPIRTWGGREYYCEAPALVKGRMMTFDYKLINYLIQGSASDCSKQALIDFYKTKPKEAKLYLSVHDEELASAPRRLAAKTMKAMTQTMEAIPFDVPMLSEGSWSAKNWAELKTYDEKGKIKCRL